MTGQLEAKPTPAAYPHTRYFEIDSVEAGARYAVWVTVPRTYDKQPERDFPAIYMPDGNSSVGIAATLPDLSEWDVMDPFEPTIQICIGYTGDEIDLALAVRARDLRPPNEYFAPVTEDHLKLSVDRGILDQAGADLYLDYLRNPAADRFLAFLTKELHPLLAAQFRIRPCDLGLFGHSYGGLFATYAALQPLTIFSRFGASSPGITPGRSVIFDLYLDAVASGDFAERYLRMTIATREITLPGTYQEAVAGGSVEFMRLAGTTPLKGLNLSNHFIDHETHMTVKPSALHDFLRTFYLRPG
jgi:predicted alpha/beta superfamily hydrolase